MRSPGFIIDSGNAPNPNSRKWRIRDRRCLLAGFFAMLFLCLALFSSPVAAQRVAVIAPDKSVRSEELAEKLLESFPPPIRGVEISMAAAAFESVPVENPYNLSIEETRRIGMVIGSEYFVLIATSTQRRSSSAKPTYFEAYASIFLASSRTGRLVFWTLARAEGDTPESADEFLMQSTVKMAGELSQKINASREEELAVKPFAPFEEVPGEGAPESAGLMPPLPFKRIKPEYTLTAFLYDVRATVDVLVDVTADGEIANTEISRWAGYGLDESVIEAVRKMNWRPATRNGRKLPMRVLLRYNFTKIDKTEN